MENNMENLPETIGDKWSLAQGNWHDNKPIIMRVRKEIDSMVGHPAYAKRYSITWKFRKKQKNGFPTIDEFTIMELFENALYEAFENGLQSIMVAVVTHAGERDWIFYTTDVEGTHQRLNDTFIGKSRYPLTIVTYDDPQWEEYKGISENIRRLDSK
jgi:hypothetical protein